MKQVDKQALREAALNAKTAGDAPVMSFDQRISAINAFTNFLTPAMAIALLDELEAKDKQIEDLKEAFNIALSAAGIDAPSAGIGANVENKA